MSRYLPVFLFLGLTACVAGISAAQAGCMAYGEMRASAPVDLIARLPPEFRDVAVWLDALDARMTGACRG